MIVRDALDTFLESRGTEVNEKRKWQSQEPQIREHLFGVDWG